MSLTSAVIQSELKTAGNHYSKSFTLQVMETHEASWQLCRCVATAWSIIVQCKRDTTLLTYSYTSRFMSSLHKLWSIRNPSGASSLYADTTHGYSQKCFIPCVVKITQPRRLNMAFFASLGHVCSVSCPVQFPPYLSDPLEYGVLHFCL